MFLELALWLVERERFEGLDPAVLVRLEIAIVGGLSLPDTFLSTCFRPLLFGSVVS